MLHLDLHNLHNLLTTTTPGPECLGCRFWKNFPVPISQLLSRVDTYYDVILCLGLLNGKDWKCREPKDHRSLGVAPGGASLEIKGSGRPAVPQLRNTTAQLSRPDDFSRQIEMVTKPKIHELLPQCWRAERIEPTLRGCITKLQSQPQTT